MNSMPWKGKRFYILLFLAAIMALFLGDGPENIIDIYFIPIIGVASWMVYKHYHQPVSLPIVPAFFWIGTILYAGAQLYISESPGLTLAGLVRLIEAFLVYRIFYTIAPHIICGALQKTILAYISAAFGIFVVFVLLNRHAPQLPSMNLLVFSHGHTHLVDLLMVGLPLVTAGVVLNNNVRHILFWIVFFGIVASFARGAWLLSTVYFLVGSLWLRKDNYLRRTALAALFIALLLLSTAISSNREHITSRFIKQSQLINKPLLPDDSRMSYWRYAWRSIWATPFFGSGLGTYYIQAKKFQERPSALSWFAHSFLLQTVAEQGAIGLFFMGGLLLYHLWIIFRIYTIHKQNQGATEDNILRLGLSWVIVFLYSFYEFNLSFLIVWLLFWVLAATVARRHDDLIGTQAMRTSLSVLASLCYLILGLYYLLVISSEVMLVAQSNPRPAFLIAPFRSVTAYAYIRSLNSNSRLIEANSERLMTLFHNNNSEVMFEFAKQSVLQGKLVQGRKLFERAIQLDLLNDENRNLAVRYLLEKNDFAGAGYLIRVFSAPSIGLSYQLILAQIDFESAEYQSVYIDSFKNNIFKQKETEELAKLYYFMGLSVYSKRPQTTRVLWTLARDLSSGWGYYHAELASLEKHVFGDADASQKALRYCRLFKTARIQCGELLISGVFPVGHFSVNIRAIPQVLLPKN